MRYWLKRPIVLRDLTVDDAPILARLHAGAFHRGWGEDEFEGLIAAATSLGQGAAFAERGRLQGFILSRMAGVEAEILSIVVHPSCRRQGVGRSLLAAHIERLRMEGVRELFLEVEEGNRGAMLFYQRFGLKEVGRREAYYPHSSGGPGAALILRGDLDR